MKDWQQLEPLIRCPFTHERLRRRTDGQIASDSGHSFAVINGVPVLRHGPAVEVKDPQHVSNLVGPAIKEMMLNTAGPVLFLGAGASDFRAPHIFEVEYNLFRNTDIVGDAHCLPFCDDTFQLVIALNVFEHLREPHAAAAELLRVLVPGGSVLIHTAYLQILHESPHHYYGATEFGVREWFRNFKDVQVRVTPNFHPYIGLSWTVNDLLWHVEKLLGSEARRTVEQMSLGQLAEYWASRKHGNEAAWQVLSQLPEPVQRQFAAGFELQAVKGA